jgi:sensor histidine kinase YesM
VSKAYILNHKMLNFIKSIVYYLTEEVVEQNWFKLSADLKKVKNFEEIIECHDSFLNNCLKESLLTNSKLLPLLNAEIGNTINNYFFLKAYLANIEEAITPIKVPFRSSSSPCPPTPNNAGTPSKKSAPPSKNCSWKTTSRS